LAPALEVYSIDESFIDLHGVPGDLAVLGRSIRQQILQWVGLPVCVGIGATKTLANHVAKKSLLNTSGVCDLSVCTAAEVSALCRGIAVDEVWGVGRRIAAKLGAMGISRVEELRQADARMLGRRFSVVLERTVRELQGQSCLALEEVSSPKQQIMASRSFGQALRSKADLAEAVASHLTRAAEKLRAQDSLAGGMMVFVQTNPFKPQSPQYSRSMTLPLPQATDDTRALVRWGLGILDALYRPGFDYKKVGVMLVDLGPKRHLQASWLEDGAGRAKSESLMATLDAINARWGRGTLRPLATGAAATAGNWRMKRQRLPPRFTTCWEELAVVGGGSPEGACPFVASCTRLDKKFKAVIFWTQPVHVGEYDERKFKQSHRHLPCQPLQTITTALHGV
jgi:DNA polymerase V